MIRGWVEPSNSDIQDLRHANLIALHDTLVLRDPSTGEQLSSANITFSHVVRSGTDGRHYSSVGE
jgi:hypothetical protein